MIASGSVARAIPRPCHAAEGPPDNHAHMAHTPATVRTRSSWGARRSSTSAPSSAITTGRVRMIFTAAGRRFQRPRFATTVRRERKELSTPDTFAFAIAECRAWPLLTGDGGLRRLAVECHVEFHGVLWICDQFESGVVPLTRLHTGLTAISSHPRCRLPAQEVRQRLDRYTGHPGNGQ